MTSTLLPVLPWQRMPPRKIPLQQSFERRALLRALSLLPLSTFASPLLAAARPLLPSPGVSFLEKTRAKLGTLVGSGLSGRRAFDLRRLVEEGLVVSSSDFFIRTRLPAGVERRLPRLADWTVRFKTGEDASGHQLDFGGALTQIPIQDLRRRSRDLGRHLLECSGNPRDLWFGLLSVAEWSGVPLAELFPETLGNAAPDARVLIRGNDEHSGVSRSATAGASWIFTIEQIKRTGAFLATRMNGEPLHLDHGAPVRLIVPGWYGCACIKWVEAVEVVPLDQPATSQMREFAGRTHQDGKPELARDYAAAEIDFAAMPILVEGPDDGGSYQITGVAWGNSEGVKSLFVRYRLEEDRSGPDDEADDAADDWQPVADFEPQAPSSWTLWKHTFAPSAQGVHAIALRSGEDGVRTRRLDSGYYTRRVALG